MQIWEVVPVSPWHLFRLRRMIGGSKMPFEDPKQHLLTGLSFEIWITRTGPTLNSTAGIPEAESADQSQNGGELVNLSTCPQIRIGVDSSPEHSPCISGNGLISQEISYAL
jgi:hypothetical protein